MHRIALYCALALLSFACQSSASSGEPKPSPNGPLCVAYTDYRSAQKLELVNESHTGRVEQYSKVGETANRKVQSDDIVDALIEHLDDEGYSKLAQAGHAPAKGDGRWLWSLEIERASGTTYVAMPSGLSTEQKAPYRALWDAFLATYNATYGLQAVKVKAGETPFKAPEPPKNVKQN
jgi:hypothetical protein